AQAGVTVPGEERLIAVPKRNVSVHTRSVVPEDWFWHERHRSVVPLGDVAQDVFVILHVVAHAFERREPDVDLSLTCGCDFVMLALDRHAGFLQLETHFVANVLQAVHGRDREITFLGANFVTEVWKLLARAVPMTLDAVDDV